MMRNIGQAIKELRLRRGWTIRKLAELVGKTPAYVSLIENRKRQLSMPLLEVFANALGVSPAYFLQDTSCKKESGEVRHKILEELWAVIERYSLPEDNKIFCRMRRIPVISCTAAGEPVAYEDMFPVGYSDEFVEAPDITDENAFALRIRGDSMEPYLSDGDIVIVCPSWKVKEGKPVVVKAKDGEVTCKIFNKSDDKVVLSASNPRYPPKVLSSESIVWMYPVVRAIKNFY
ncbi:MAG: XRE family transcriptional regulator [Planctomycetota bacterium]|nr:XRE family transcriptional regulator [Planctomycetota bacterium]